MVVLLDPPDFSTSTLSQTKCTIKLDIIMSGFLSLYLNVLVPILTEWIYDEDLCCLDTAMCSHGLRSLLLKVLERCSIHNADVKRREQQFYDFVWWLLARKMGLARFNNDWDITAWEISQVASAKCQLSTDSCWGRLLLEVTGPTDLLSHPIASDCLDDSEALVSIGTKIIELTLGEDCKHELQIAVACPNLQQLQLNESGNVLPFIEHCLQLEVILKCYVGILFNKRVSQKANTCDLRRASVVDESAVSLGEGKYLNLTGLYMKHHVSTEGQVLLAPLLIHLTSLQNSADQPILRTIADCRADFTTLSLYNVQVHQTDYLYIAVHSWSLTDLTLTALVEKGKTMKFDGLLECVAEYCPVLRTCRLTDFIMSPTLLESFLQKSTLRRLDLLYSTLTTQRFRLSIDPRGLKTILIKGCKASKRQVKVVMKHHPHVRIW